MVETLKFVDLFAGLGGFHLALHRLGHECVFASELDLPLQQLYARNFSATAPQVHGDIRLAREKVPPHDVLCAGFPCQPFSKSGSQLGIRDETRGTLFHEILAIIDRLGDRKPSYLILENVGNFPRHDSGNTWRVVRASLESRGYTVAGTEPVTPQRRDDWRDRGARKASPDIASAEQSSRGMGLLSPHHFGYPHHRERFFIVAAVDGLPASPFPTRPTVSTPNLAAVTQHRDELSTADRTETRPTTRQVRCIEHWNALVQSLPESIAPPSFPLWGEELDAKYPYEEETPFASNSETLRDALSPRYSFPPGTPHAVMMAELPSYAREETHQFREWKIHFIRQNRKWWQSARPYLPPGWVDRLWELPSSLQKLEWNVKGGERDIWRYVLQFRPSGLRVRRYSSAPALVAMTITQVPFLGPERRFLTRAEGLRLQDFPDGHGEGLSRTQLFRAVGNAVHVGVVEKIARNLLRSHPTIPSGDRG